MQSAIHCKIYNEDSIRRFTLSELTYASLVKQVSQLFGLKDPIVLKYKDNEGDFVTVSSDSELVLATSFMSETLQLHVSQRAASNITSQDAVSVTPTSVESFNDHHVGVSDNLAPTRAVSDNFYEHEFKHKHRRGGNNRGNHHHEKRQACFERKRERLTKNLEKIQAKSVGGQHNDRATERVASLQSELLRLAEELSSLSPPSVPSTEDRPTPTVVKAPLVSAPSLSTNNDNHGDIDDNHDTLTEQIFELKERIHQLRDSLKEERQKLRESRGFGSEEALDAAWEAFRTKQAELRGEVDKLHDLKGKKRHAKCGNDNDDGECTSYGEKHGVRGHHHKADHHKDSHHGKRKAHY